jgi:hypothetical protein
LGNQIDDAFERQAMEFEEVRQHQVFDVVLSVHQVEQKTLVWRQSEIATGGWTFYDDVLIAASADQAAPDDAIAKCWAIERRVQAFRQLLPDVQLRALDRRVYAISTVLYSAPRAKRMPPQSVRRPDGTYVFLGLNSPAHSLDWRSFAVDR